MQHAPSLVPVPSPCRGECTASIDGTRCLGCGRTMDEIMRWPTMTNDERRAVAERVKDYPGPDR